MELLGAFTFLIVLDFLSCIILAINYREARERYILFFLAMIVCELSRQSLSVFVVRYPEFPVLLALSGTIQTIRGGLLLCAVASLLGRRVSSTVLLAAVAAYPLLFLTATYFDLSRSILWVVTGLPVLGLHGSACIFLAIRWRSQGQALRILLILLIIESAILLLLMASGALPDILRIVYFSDSITMVLVTMAALLVTTERLQVALQRSKRSSDESEERYRTVFDSAFDGIVTLDNTGAVTDLNRRGESIFGRSKDEVLGKSFSETMLSGRSAKAFQRASDKYFRSNESGRLFRTREVEGRRSDGAHVPIELTLRPGRRDEIRTLNVFARDLTAQKESEEASKRFEAQIQHAQKLESLGVLAGGIAHDFNNLLVGVLGFAGLAKEQLSEDSPAMDDLDEIEKAARRASDLTNQMLAYAGKGKMSLSPLNVSDVISDMSALIESSISRKANLTYSMDKKVPLVEADASQIGQIVLNLVSNASDSLDDEPGEITLATGTREVDAAYQASTFAPEFAERGPHVFIEVADTGCGMDEESVGRIFEPFFSTKFTGRGLGMAAVIGIVGRHRGAIRVQSKPGRGTTITVLLPLVSVKPGVARPIVAADSGKSDDGAVSWRRRGNILVVDDEPGVLRLAHRVLGEKGLRVITAEDGERGIELFQKHREKLEAVILDLTMPKIAGLEAFETMSEIDSTIPIVLSSGYNEATAQGNFGDREFAGFIQKPYSPSTLIAAIRRVMDGD